MSPLSSFLCSSSFQFSVFYIQFFFHPCSLPTFCFWFTYTFSLSTSSIIILFSAPFLPPLHPPPGFLLDLSFSPCRPLCRSLSKPAISQGQLELMVFLTSLNLSPHTHALPASIVSKNRFMRLTTRDDG